MAFPIPGHLPRKAVPQDISSSILNAIDAATHQTLKSDLARSWLAVLDEHIQTTRQQIRDRIQSDSSTFETLLESAKSVRERLQALEADIDTLQETVSNSETGLIPTVTQRLQKHNTLAQEAANADVWCQAVLHLSRCQNQYTHIEALVRVGKLTEAVQAIRKLNALLNSAPTALTRAKILDDFKRKTRVIESLVEEQLNDAYSRSINLMQYEMSVCPSVQVRGSTTDLDLSAILSALSHESLNGHLSIFRRDLTTHFVDHILKEPCSVAVEVDTSGRSKLMCLSPPPDSTDLSLRLSNLSTVFDFLGTRLFPHVPTSQKAPFLYSLSKVLSNSVLNNLLRSFLPSAFGQLSSYLSVVQKAVEFEQDCIIRLLGGDPNDRAIQSWSSGLAGHYERKRRVEILDASRMAILLPDNTGDHFSAEIELAPIQSSPAPSQEVADEDEAKVPGDSEDAWGFGDDEGQITIDEDSWGFDDDVVDPEVRSDEHSPKEIKARLEDAEPDPGDAWGWNDGNDATVDNSGEDGAWDDPWAESLVSEKNDGRSEAFAIPAPKASEPKVASKLEKLAAKNKKHSTADVQPLSSQVTSSLQPTPKSPGISLQPVKANEREGLKSASEPPPPPKNTNVVVKESYRVSGRMRRLVKLVEDVVSEGKQMSTSNLLPPTASGSSLGTIVLQAALSTLDLFRALYPAKNARRLELPDRAMAFSNDCLYLSSQIDRIMNGPARELAMIRSKFEECKSRFILLSESWYYDTIDYQGQKVDKILTDGAKGFVYSADQEQYDECESAVHQVLKEIRHLANKWKELLPKSKYYSALGSVTEAALSRILDDILALPDIPEVESHRLGELCRILNALEGIFVESANQPSFVLAYVPSWLKFSYLSELLEASMADISYLFETGALVDFSVDELVRLVRALFADTNLRTNTINKILAGHPAAP